MTDLNALKQANAALWAKAKIIPGRRAEVMFVARRLAAPTAKARYQEIEAATSVPWFVVAIIHEREASGRWDRQLGQGDPLSEVSHNKPKGRGPFRDRDGHDAFYWGAVDALTNCPPYAARWKDWSIGGALTALILYNGTGYEDHHHEVSPYDWGATDQEQRGKYTGDNHFEASVWDTQIGCAALLMAMMALDSSISFGTKPTAENSMQPAPKPTPTPPHTQPKAAPNIWAALFGALASILSAIFKKK